MSDDVANLIRETAAQASAEDAKLRSQARTPAGSSASLLYSFVPGTPVLDLVTGLEGVVIDARRENVIISAA